MNRRCLQLDVPISHADFSDQLVDLKSLYAVFARNLLALCVYFDFGVSLNEKNGGEEYAIHAYLKWLMFIFILFTIKLIID